MTTFAGSSPSRRDRVIDDTEVGLVRHQPVDVGDRQPGAIEHPLDRIDHHPGRETVDLGAVHRQEPVLPPQGLA